MTNYMYSKPWPRHPTIVSICSTVRDVGRANTMSACNGCCRFQFQSSRWCSSDESDPDPHNVAWQARYGCALRRIDIHACYPYVRKHNLHSFLSSPLLRLEVQNTMQYLWFIYMQVCINSTPCI